MAVLWGGSDWCWLFHFCHGFLPVVGFAGLRLPGWIQWMAFTFLCFASFGNDPHYWRGSDVEGAVHEQHAGMAVYSRSLELGDGWLHFVTPAHSLGRYFMLQDSADAGQIRFYPRRWRRLLLVAFWILVVLRLAGHVFEMVLNWLRWRSNRLTLSVSGCTVSACTML